MLTRRATVERGLSAGFASALPVRVRADDSAGAPGADRPNLRFGIVADVQYADKPPSGRRDYRGSLAKAARCVEAWNGADLAFAIELGDLTDDRARDGTREDLARICDVFTSLRPPLRHVVGNHGPPTAGRQAYLEALGLERPWYDFGVPGWRFVVLDATGLSLKAWPAGSPRRAQSEAFSQAHRGCGTPEPVDHNGGIDPEQMAWLRGVLAKAVAARERVAVFCHTPVLAEASRRSHLLWNHGEVLAVLEACPAVAVYFAGHDHRGGCAFRNGIHHVTLEGMVESPPGGNAFGIVAVCPDRLVLLGVGTVTSRTMALRAG